MAAAKGSCAFFVCLLLLSCVSFLFLAVPWFLFFVVQVVAFSFLGRAVATVAKPMVSAVGSSRGKLPELGGGLRGPPKAATCARSTGFPTSPEGLQRRNTPSYWILLFEGTLFGDWLKGKAKGNQSFWSVPVFQYTQDDQALHAL